MACEIDVFIYLPDLIYVSRSFTTVMLFGPGYMSNIFSVCYQNLCLAEGKTVSLMHQRNLYSI